MKYASLCLSALCVSFLYIVLLAPLPTLAHSTGASFEQVVNDMLVDVGYSPDPVQTGEPTTFDFLLFEDGTNEAVAFESVHVSIAEKGNEVPLTAGRLSKEEIGPTRFVYTFPHKGTYAIEVRYINDGEAIVETTFELDVLESETSKPSMAPLFIAAILFLLALIFYVSVRHNSRNQDIDPQ